MILKIVAFLYVVYFFEKMDKAKESKDLCEIIYWSVLFITSIFMLYVCR